MRLLQRKMAKNAMRAFVLLFALQVIAVLGLCAVHDLTSTPTAISDGISLAWLSQVGEPGFAPQNDGMVSDQTRHGYDELDHCDVPLLLAADARLPTPGAYSMVYEMAPAWQQATLKPPSSGSALPPRWVSLTGPPPRSSLLDIAPRLRI